jgi:hypothetical protein
LDILGHRVIREKFIREIIKQVLAGKTFDEAWEETQAEPEIKP